jgi:type I restriction enzyme S subunit
MPQPDWKATPLKEVLGSLRAGVSVNSSDEPDGDLTDQPSVLKTSAVVGGRFFPGERKTISRGDLARARINPADDAILISRMNTPQLVGECGYVDREYPQLFLPDRLWMAQVKPGTVARWLAHLLSSEPYRRRLKLLATGTSGSMKNISRPALFELEIPLPLKQEQKAIADALTAADESIEAIERLIEKKRRIKRGVLQKLVVGTARLPGFSGEWEQRELGDVLKVRHGKSQKDVEVPNGRYPILATGGEIGRTDTPLYSKPSVLIGRKGTIDSPQYRDQPFWSVDTLFYTDVHGANAKYIFYLFQTIDWRSLNEASGVPSLSASRIEGLPVFLPPPDEQQAIAAVLSDMDAEIEALQARLVKARDIKRGMMQELLPDRSRLVPEAAAA